MKYEGLNGIGFAIAIPLLCVIFILLDLVIPDFVKVIGILFLCVFVIPVICGLIVETIKKLCNLFMLIIRKIKECRKVGK